MYESYLEIHSFVRQRMIWVLLLSRNSTIQPILFLYIICIAK